MLLRASWSCGTGVNHHIPWHAVSAKAVEMAKIVNALSGKAGAVSATIAITDGTNKNWFTGVTAEATQRGYYCDEGFAKRSGSAVAERRMGATTVATTMMCSHGRYSIFVTGGVGGVHRSRRKR